MPACQAALCLDMQRATGRGGGGGGADYTMCNPQQQNAVFVLRRGDFWHTASLPPSLFRRLTLSPYLNYPSIAFTTDDIVVFNLLTFFPGLIELLVQESSDDIKVTVVSRGGQAKSQIRRFLGLFLYGKSAKFLGVPVRKSQIRKFL